MSSMQADAEVVLAALDLLSLPRLNPKMLPRAPAHQKSAEWLPDPDAANHNQGGPCTIAEQVANMSESALHTPAPGSVATARH